MNDLHLHHPEYTPNNLLDAISDRLHAKNDAELCRLLNVAPPLISKIRHHHLGIGPMLLISMHEESGLSIKELRMLMGDRRTRFQSIQMEGNKKGPPKRPRQAGS